jgi:hypothetical protein
VLTRVVAETAAAVVAPCIRRSYPSKRRLTPLEFARRARRIYPHREAVVDGELRLTYSEFFERCDRWSAALSSLGVRQGDRIVRRYHGQPARIQGRRHPAANLSVPGRYDSRLRLD